MEPAIAVWLRLGGSCLQVQCKLYPLQPPGASAHVGNENATRVWAFPAACSLEILKTSATARVSEAPMTCHFVCLEMLSPPTILKSAVLNLECFWGVLESARR